MNHISHQSADILVVDDAPANLEILIGALKERGHRVRPVLDGRQAIEVARRDPPALVLLDINMPDMDGYEVCAEFKRDPQLSEIPIIFLSANTGTEDKVRAFEAGGVDYVNKPFHVEEVYARVDTHLNLRSLRKQLVRHNMHLEELVLEKTEEITAAQMATIFALARLAESRDDAIGQHLERTSAFCRMLATQMGAVGMYAGTLNASYASTLFFAAPLHDIGKVAIPDAILLKPGKLTPDEFAIMKTHAAIGAHTLETVLARYPGNTFLAMGRDVARSHHEQWDGSGYPDGLVGEEIPLCGRIMALADVYDALRSKRVYKEGFDHEKTREIILDGVGVHFDPAVVEAFMGCQSEMESMWDRMSGDGTALAV